MGVFMDGQGAITDALLGAFVGASVVIVVLLIICLACDMINYVGSWVMTMFWMHRALEIESIDSLGGAAEASWH